MTAVDDPRVEMMRVVNDELVPAVARLRRTGAINRGLIYALAVAFAAIAVLGFFAHQAIDRAETAADAARLAQDAQHASCLASNEGRQNIVTFFDSLIAESTETAAGKAKALAAVAAAYPPRAC